MREADFLDTQFICGDGGPYCFNNVLISTAAHVVLDPDVIAYRVFKGIVLVLAEAFEPDEVIRLQASLASGR